MGSTKIINVLKNDTFEEVFDLFKNTDAQEVIFILPRGSRLAKSPRYFEEINNKASEAGIRVSVMTSDPTLINFAVNNNFDVLSEKQSKSRSDFGSHPSKTPAPKTEVAIELNDNNFIAEEIGELASVNYIKNSPDKPIKDILYADVRKEIKIKEEKTRHAEIEIKNSLDQNIKNQSDIGKIWMERERSYKKLPKVFTIKTPLIIVSGAVIVLALILYLTLGSAAIILHPQKTEINFKSKITASAAESSINPGINTIPGQKFSVRAEENGSFPVTGHKEVAQKARGKITIFNKSFSEQRLVATTRFKTSDGLIFRIPQTITVPAARQIGKEVIEGSVESTVNADQPGEKYNIGSAQFTIPGFEGTPKSTEFYAKSSQPMSGGLIGPATVVTEEDFSKAEQATVSKLKEKILNSLKEQAGELKIIDSVSYNLEPLISNAKVGEAADNLTINMAGSAETIAFRESDIIELTKQAIEKDGNLELIANGLKLEYSEPKIEPNAKTMNFDIVLKEGFAAAKLNQEKIINDILGMKEKDIRPYFEKIKEIQSAKITLSPFWVKSIPKDADKIKLLIEI